MFKNLAVDEAIETAIQGIVKGTFVLLVSYRKVVIVELFAE